VQGNAQRGWDLHCHTVYSDGTLSPRDLVDLGEEKGLGGVAITDHDTTAGWADAGVAARACHYPVMRGSEITADHHGISVHMLAYLYIPDNPVLQALFAATRARRIERTKCMVERLSHDFPITWDDVVAQTKEGEDTTIGRPHIADALVAAGVYPDRSAAFAAAVGGKSKYFIPVTSPRVESVIQAVKTAGGVVFIAHPGASSRNRHLLSDEDFHAFADLGLDGLEVHHRDNSPEQQARLTRIATEYNLLRSGGSDWHGAGKPNVLGENTTDPQTVAEIVRRGTIELVGTHLN
ncbi:MAG: PHP domain-containing protein, partial [Bifidobacteriaceae bacterium]|nr:PHP domain-containing protein [Bifidobacteriaceae bacterium]